MLSRVVATKKEIQSKIMTMIVMMIILIVTFQCRNNVVQFSNSLLGSALGQGVVAKI